MEWGLSLQSWRAVEQEEEAGDCCPCYPRSCSPCCLLNPGWSRNPASGGLQPSGWRPGSGWSWTPSQDQSPSPAWAAGCLSSWSPSCCWSPVPDCWSWSPVSGGEAPGHSAWPGQGLGLAREVVGGLGGSPGTGLELLDIGLDGGRMAACCCFSKASCWPHSEL